MEPYYTISVPWVPPQYRTEWHPDYAVGPFSVLNRGAFKTFEAAIEWGKAHLAGTPYSVRRVEE